MLYQFEMIKTDGNLPTRFFYSPTGQKGGMYQHWHNTLEVIYLLSGSVDVTVNNQVYSLKPGDIITINPNHIHATDSDDLNTSAYILQVPFSYMQHCYRDAGNLIFNTYHQPVPEIEELKALFERFNETYQESDDLKALRINALVYELMYLMIKYFSTTDHNPGELNEVTLNRLTKITMYIDENYMKQLSLKIVADEIGITTEHLSRFFKKHMSISFVTYVDMVRLNHASSLLMNTNRSISYISDVCGFTTYRIFTNKFKKSYYMTPREFRLLHRKASDELKELEKKSPHSS